MGVWCVIGPPGHLIFARFDGGVTRKAAKTGPTGTKMHPPGCLPAHPDRAASPRYSAAPHLASGFLSAPTFRSSLFPPSCSSLRWSASAASRSLISACCRSNFSMLSAYNSSNKLIAHPFLRCSSRSNQFSNVDDPSSRPGGAITIIVEGHPLQHPIHGGAGAQVIFHALQPG